MEQKPNNNSDTSSADLNHSPSAEKPNKDSGGGGGGASTASSGGARSYECTFCKRGFTNAQALGGHMNIHRKDKAKAKATTPKTHHDFPLIQTFQSKESFNDLKSNGNPVFGAHDKNYHHLYFPPSDRVIQTGTTFQYHDYFPVWRPDQLQDNLSLRIGLSCPPVQDHDHEVEDHIDLELRLGQYP